MKKVPNQLTEYRGAMRFIVFTAICILTAVLTTRAQQPVFWKEYGTSSFPYNQGYGLKTTSDSGVVTCGYSDPGLAIVSIEATITKFSQGGNVQWDKRYTGINIALEASDIELVTGGYLAGGSTYSPSTAPGNPSLLRTDIAGNVLWSNIYDYAIPFDHAIKDVATFPNGDIVFSSSSNEMLTPTYAFVTKTDAAGNVIWARRIFPGSSANVTSRQVKITAAGDILATGSYFNPAYTGHVNYVIKLDPAGNTIWFKEYVLSAYTSYGVEATQGFFETPAGEIIVPFWIISGGISFPADPPPGREGPYMLKLDATGNVKFCKDYGRWFSGSMGTKYLAGNNTLTYFMGNIDTAISNFNQGLFFTVDSIGRVLTARAYNNPAWLAGYSGDGGGSNAFDSTVTGGFISYSEVDISGGQAYHTSLIALDGLGYSGGCFESPTCVEPRCVPVQANNISGVVSLTPAVSSPTLTVLTGLTQTVVCAGTSTLSKAAVNQTLAAVFPTIEKNLVLPDTIVLPACNAIDTVFVSYPACKGIDSVSWSTGSTNQTSIAVTTPGIYWVAAFDCAVNAPVMIDTFVVVSSASAYFTSTINPVICHGQTYTLSSGLTATVSGIYQDTLVSGLGCDTIRTVNLNVIPGFSVNVLSSHTLTCVHLTSTLSASSSVAGLTYTWLPGGSNSTSLSVNAPGIYTLTSSNNPMLLCMSVATVAVGQNTTAPTFTASPPALLTCTNLSTTLQVIPNPAGSGIQWTGGPAGASYTVSLPGTYTVVITDPGNGCNTEGTVTASELTTFSLNLSKKDLCFGSTVSQATAAVSGGLGPYSYLWSGSQTGAVATGLGPGTHTVLVTDLGTGCVKTNTVLIAQLSEVTTTIGVSPAMVCQGDKVALTATSNVSPALLTYLWSTGASSNPATAVLTASSVISLTVTDGNNCPNTASMAVNVYPLPAVSFTASVLKGCEPLCVTFSTSSPALSYFWEFGDNSNSPALDPKKCFKAGEYYVYLHVKDANGCGNALMKPGYIRVYPQPQAIFYATPNPASILEPTVHFVNNSVNANLYLWDFGELKHTSAKTNPLYVYQSPGNYLVTLVARNNFDCADTAFMRVIVEDDFTIYIPNTFTPNADDLNDTWGPHGAGISNTDYELTVFDRWGEQIFRSTAFAQRWDGTYKGEMVKDGTYIYRLQVRSEVQSKLYRFKGHVNVMK